MGCTQPGEYVRSCPTHRRRTVAMTANCPARTRNVWPRSRRRSSASTWSGVRLRSSGGSRVFAIAVRSPGGVLICPATMSIQSHATGTAPPEEPMPAECSALYDQTKKRIDAAWKTGPLLGQEGQGLQRGDLEWLSAAHIGAGQLVIAAHHIRLRFGEPGAIAFIGMTGQLRFLAADDPGDFVLGSLSALGAGQSVGAHLSGLVKKLAFFHGPRSQPAWKPDQESVRPSRMVLTIS